ncbi:MAG: phage portal protein [Pyrinomonadaceae bacterium]
MAANSPQIAEALKNFKDNRDRYKRATDYFNGEHDLSYATEKFKTAFGTLFRTFALNLCPAVCDAVTDKLIVTGFKVEKGDASEVPEQAWRIWQANRMGTRAGEIHKEAVKVGDAYAIVWPDPVTGKLTIYPNRAETCTVKYDDETPNTILWAAKYWKITGKKYRLNIYYPDRVERFVTAKENELLPDADAFVEFDGDKAGPVIANPYGTVPVFHFANKSGMRSFGQSEFEQSIPLQDALNKSVLDMLVAMEFAAFRQRWATGIEMEYDDQGNPKAPFAAGVEKLWVSENSEVKFGDFEAANLEQFLSVKDGFRTDISCQTGTPLHYFMLTGAAFPQSGISIEKLESRFLAKVRDKMESFGQVWEDLMAFALRVENAGDNIQLFTEWQDPAPISETEKLDALIQKQTLGVPDERLWMEAGYGEADITEMKAIADAKQEANVRRFNAGEVEDPLTAK